MKTINLSQGQVAIVDDEDFEYLNQWKWHAHYDITVSSYYAVRNIYLNGKRTSVSMHRVILGLIDKRLHGDHINHNTLDNRRNNLRIASLSGSKANMRPRQGTTSKFLGVCWKRQNRKWNAAIKKNGKTKYIGLFEDEIEAAKAYDRVAREVHGEFANLNFKD